MNPESKNTDESSPQQEVSFVNKLLTRVGLISPAEAAVAVDSETPEPTALRITMRQAGFRAAGQHNGLASALEVHLHRVLSALHEQFDQSHKQQDVARKQKQAEIDATDTDIAYQQDERRMAEGRLEACQQQVVGWKKEIHTLHRDPASMNLPEPSKLLMRVALGLLVGITLYLFVFYSSAGYLAFFKTATGDDLGDNANVLSALFEATAFQKAYDSGFGAFLLICALPFVFMGLGYLLHEFIAKKQYKALTAVLVASFIFDYIIGYEIVKRVHEAQQMGEVEGKNGYPFSDAIQDMNLWLILFAGFVVYLVWGFVFHFFMEAHHRNNKVAMAIKEREEQIGDAEQAGKRHEEEIGKLKLAVRDLTMQRHRLVAELAGVLIPAREWANYLMEFSGGWLAWMAGAEQSYNKQVHCKERLDNFVHQHLGHDTVLSYRSSGLVPPVTAPPITINPPLSIN